MMRREISRRYIFDKEDVRQALDDYMRKMDVPGPSPAATRAILQFNETAEEAIVYSWLEEIGDP